MCKGKRGQGYEAVTAGEERVVTGRGVQQFSNVPGNGEEVNLWSFCLESAVGPQEEHGMSKADGLWASWQIPNFKSISWLCRGMTWCQAFWPLIFSFLVGLQCYHVIRRRMMMMMVVMCVCVYVCTQIPTKHDLSTVPFVTKCKRYEVQKSEVDQWEFHLYALEKIKFWYYY